MIDQDRVDARAAFCPAQAQLRCDCAWNEFGIGYGCQGDHADVIGGARGQRGGDRQS
jgi:hypothetical protein